MKETPGGGGEIWIESAGWRNVSKEYDPKRSGVPFIENSKPYYRLDNALKMVGLSMANYVNLNTPVYSRVGVDSDRLTAEQQKANAEYIFNYLSLQGWSKEAICGLLGNIHHESFLNPGVWEIQDDPFWGYGIVQWTAYPRTRETPNPFLHWSGLTRYR